MNEDVLKIDHDARFAENMGWGSVPIFNLKRIIWMKKN